MTTAVHYSEVNGTMVQDGLNPLQGIQDPGPGTCINCGQYIPKLNHHYSQYFGYFCLPPYEANGTDPRPILPPAPPGSVRDFGDGTFGSGTFGSN
jgi:hypothetical protein